jgi:hypothetical protein
MSKEPTREDWVMFAYYIVWGMGHGTIEELKATYKSIYGREMSA